MIFSWRYISTRLESRIMKKNKALFFILYLLCLFVFMIQTVISSQLEEALERKSRVLTDLKKHVQTHRANLEDYCEMLKTKGDSALDVSAAIIIAQRNIESIQLLEGRLSELLQGSKTIEDTIYWILASRLSTLEKRKGNIIKAQQNPELVYGLSDPQTLDKLSPDACLHVEIATDTYQTFNRIIVGFSSVMDLRKLSPHVKNLIRMSPTLWPRILGQDSDWGHPDEAIFIKKGTFGQDVSLYETHLLESKLYEMTCYSGFHTFKKWVNLTPFDYYQLGLGTEKIPPLPYPDFLMPSPSLDIMSQKQNEDEEPVLVSKDKKSIPEKKTSHMTKILKPKKILPPLVLDADREKKDEPLVNLKKLEEGVSIKELEATQEGQQPVSEKECTELVVPSYEEKKSPVELGEKEKQEDLESFPNLKGKHLKTYQDIFDPQAFSTVDFDRFAALWTHVGGEIKKSRSGGSHRTLIWKGKAIGGTFVPHGGHEYGKRSIGSLRDALTEIGFGEKE